MKISKKTGKIHSKQCLTNLTATKAPSEPTRDSKLYPVLIFHYETKKEPFKGEDNKNNNKLKPHAYEQNI
jgi:hypothetical protein